MSYYFSKNQAGLIEANAANDGYSATLRWSAAYPTVTTNKIAYNIYYTNFKDTIYSEGPKFIVADGSTQAVIINLSPGDTYYFSVRAVEYDPTLTNVAQIPKFSGSLLVYPETLLSVNVGLTDTVFNVLDVSTFPSFGIIRIGHEAIRYTSTNKLTNQLITLNSLFRGYLGSVPATHRTDGYDGYAVQDVNIGLLLGNEESNTKIFETQCRFDIDNYAYTTKDGYRQRTMDLLTVDLASSDHYNVGFNSYDYAGYHSTDPVQLLNGDCVGSYIGGEQYCVDGYNGVGMVLRGFSFQEQSNQRLEELLTVTGEHVVLVRKQRQGIICSCVRASTEYADDRCPRCLGSGLVSGWEQYYNPRRADSKIMIRIGPNDDKVRPTEAGFESESILDCWTLVVPTVKDRDFFIRFDQDGNEEFRYEILSVTRNRLLQGLSGAQKFKAQRVRKTDPIYQVRVFRNTEPLPARIQTSIASSPGILPHMHDIIYSSSVTSPNQLNGTTSIVQGHSHVIIGGLIGAAGSGESLHTHTIVIP